MKKLLTKPMFHAALAATAVGGVLAWTAPSTKLEASSHREAPLIADDPLADNTDLYAFKDPTNPEMINIIANYIPFELPQGGPNFNTFGENIRYEIHIKNKPVVARAAGDPTSPGDDITYRFTFTRQNEDVTTFFRVRLGKENLKTTYKLERSTDNNVTFTTLIDNGEVPAPNVGPRTIGSPGGVGLKPAEATANYQTYADSKIRTIGTDAATQIKVFCGSTDDPFFTDLGAIFDLGDVRTAANARDGLARKNVHAIVMQIPVRVLQRDNRTVAQAANILDPNYVIGVWASASRLAVRTLSATGAKPTETGNYIQVSRIGMPLTNEVVIPIGLKDRWNSDDPFTQVADFDDRAMNPELGLYMAEGMANGETYYGAAIPGFAPLRIQARSLAGVAGLPAGGFDFRNGADGLFPLTPAQRAGTVFADPTFGPYLLRDNKPRSVDLLPIFHTGVPNLAPYQLATGKAKFGTTQVTNPLTAGKPFINNFLPTFGDMLRLNMAVPATQRTIAAGFSSEGLLQAAVLGLTKDTYTGFVSSGPNDIQFIPNMDGFPNGRRLEDDVTRIELQAVAGVVLHAIGVPFDDAADLGQVLGFTTNVEANDTQFRTTFPYVATAWSGINAQPTPTSQFGPSGLNAKPTLSSMQVFPNPVADRTSFKLNVGLKANLTIVVSDITGKRVATIANNKTFAAGDHTLVWTPGREVAPGQYIATVYSGRTVIQSVHIQRD